MATSRPKTFTFTTGVTWREGVLGTVTSPGLPDLSVSRPKDMRGVEGAWTPEALFVASVESCLFLTFLSLAQSRKLEFVAYESQAEGVLEPLYGKHVVSKVTVRPRIVIKREDDREKLQGIIERMEPNCFISNSIESDVVLEPDIVVDGG